MGFGVSSRERVFSTGKLWGVVMVDVWRCERGSSGNSSSVESLGDVLVGGILTGWR
jgi:hypothetical protein